jgi:hypothetical protein
MPQGERSNTGVSHVSALTERESPRGWTFDVVIGEGETERHVDVVLAWVDYEYWSHGTTSPSVIAEYVVRAVIDAEPKRELPDRFDCSTARRWVRDLDRRVREML